MKAENQKSAVLSCHKTHGTTILHKLTMAVVKNSATKYFPHVEMVVKYLFY
jgi:hypothetical protein